jgi:hypothetical protein
MGLEASQAEGRFIRSLLTGRLRTNSIAGNILMALGPASF